MSSVKSQHFQTDPLPKTDRSRLDLLAGFDYNHSKFSTPLTRNSGELFWGDDYNFKLSSVTSFVQTFRMFNDMSDLGTYRVNADIGLSTKLWKRLSWDVSLSDRYLSNPAPGRKTNDLLYTTGLGISFARRSVSEYSARLRRDGLCNPTG